jgi:aspartokinase/homoserine dehydrogenase 1
LNGAGWDIHKFGGSSLRDAECFRRVAAILRDAFADRPAPRIAVVVSAMGGMTDALLALVDQAERADEGFRDGLQVLRDRHRDAVVDLLGEPAREEVLAAFEDDAEIIVDVLRGVLRLRSASRRTRDVVAGFGELWSARLLRAVLRHQLSDADVECLDAREAIIVQPGEMGPSVLWERSRARLAERVASDFHGIVVVTGFIASDADGLQTTLGRNGSDFTASIMAALLGADDITIWTDVTGVMSGDPRRVPEATVIDEISYNEAMELAYFGTTVIHPQTMGPAIEHNIPIRIRCTFAPEHPGTRIVADSDSDSGQRVKGITAIEDVALVNLEGAGMIGVPGTADRLFGALRDVGVSVIMISQGSSEHSICFAVPGASGPTAVEAARRAFAAELTQGQVQRIDLDAHCAILALVGDGMAGRPGVAARLFSTLGRAGINVRAIAQGASERNISAVVDAIDTTRALRAIHSGFYLSAKTISIGVIGEGHVGSALLDQIAAQSATLRERFSLDLRVRAIASSRTMTLGEKSLDLSRWRELREAEHQPASLDALVDHVHTDNLPHALIVDCTASGVPAAQYADWLSRGVHVITPNKKAHSGRGEYYELLKNVQRRHGTHFLYETTVGAGLPIIQTLRDLVDTGDELKQIEGIFSGTLAYLFNVYDGSRGFADLVASARESGYTEPDPREDLSGMDVARKTVILAREGGMSLELEELDVESLVPAALAEGSVDQFLARFGEYDEQMRARVEQSAARGEVLRYVARLDFETGAAGVRLQSLPGDHPFAMMNLTDNIVRFVTARYDQNPLIVQGPGAGPEVTAGGVFADILRLGARLSG